MPGFWGLDVLKQFQQILPYPGERFFGQSGDDLAHEPLLDSVYRVHFHPALAQERTFLQIAIIESEAIPACASA